MDEIPRRKTFPWKKFFLFLPFLILLLLGGTWLLVDQLGKYRLSQLEKELAAEGFETDWLALRQQLNQSMPAEDDILAHPIMPGPDEDWPEQALYSFSDHPDLVSAGWRAIMKETFDPRLCFNDPSIFPDEASAAHRLLEIGNGHSELYQGLISALSRPQLSLPIDTQVLMFEDHGRISKLNGACGMLAPYALIQLHAGRPEVAYQAALAITNAANCLPATGSGRSSLGILVTQAILQNLHPILHEAAISGAWSAQQWREILGGLQAISPPALVANALDTEIAYSIHCAANLEALMKETEEASARLMAALGTTPNDEFEWESLLPEGYWKARLSGMIEQNASLARELAPLPPLVPQDFGNTLTRPEPGFLGRWVELPLTDPEEVFYLAKCFREFQANVSFLTIETALITHYRETQSWPSKLAETALARFFIEKQRWPASLDEIPAQWLDPDQLAVVRDFDIDYHLDKRGLPVLSFAYRKDTSLNRKLLLAFPPEATMP